MTAAQKILLALLLAVAGAAGGWTAQGWRKDAEIADLKRTEADTLAGQYGVALADLAAASQRISAAATGARVDLSAVTGKLDTIRKEFKDAKPAPLPPDCKPDSVRVRHLSAASSAVDAALAGSVPGRALPAEWPASGR